MVNKTILMATDSSAQALKAIELGCVLAGQDDGRLGFVHVLLRDKTPDELQTMPTTGALGENLAGELKRTTWVAARSPS